MIQILGKSTTPKESPPATAMGAAHIPLRINRSASSHLKIDISNPLFRNVKSPATPSPIDGKLLSHLDSELSVTRSQFLHSPDPSGASLKIALDSQLASVKEQFLECAAAEIIKNPDFCGSILEAALDKHLAAVEKDFKDSYKKSASIKTAYSDAAVSYSRNISQMITAELKEALATQLANTKAEFVDRYKDEQVRQAKSISSRPETTDSGQSAAAEPMSIRDMVELYSPNPSEFEASISGSDDNGDSQIDGREPIPVANLIKQCANLLPEEQEVVVYKEAIICALALGGHPELASGIPSPKIDGDVIVPKTIGEVKRGRSMFSHSRGSHVRSNKSRAFELVARKRKESFGLAAGDPGLEGQLAAECEASANKKRVALANNNLTGSGGRTVFPRMDSFYNTTVLGNTDDVKYFKFKLDGRKITLVQNSRTAYRIRNEDLARAGIAEKDFADVHRFILNTTVKRIKVERLQREAEKTRAREARDRAA